MKRSWHQCLNDTGYLNRLAKEFQSTAKVPYYQKWAKGAKKRAQNWEDALIFIASRIKKTPVSIPGKCEGKRK